MLRPIHFGLSFAVLCFAAQAWTARADAPDSVGTPPASQPTVAVHPDGKDRPQIEVCFVLDTTGSMGGLIEGAKQKIWSIANMIIAVKDKPQIKLALIGYRDKGDKYITKVFDLTDDIDTVFKNLQGFQADGGGDTPESVNQALNEAVTKIGWSDKKDVTRLIFLVGDAPPHMDYKDDVKYPETLKLAEQKGIIINAVQCGAMPETTPVWQEIAKLGHGSYVAIEQEGGMVAIATPFDKELAELNAKVVTTTVAYGDVKQQKEVMAKADFAATQPAAVSAERAKFYHSAGLGSASSGAGYRSLGGKGDLVYDCNNDVVKLEDLKPEQLPPEMQKMSPAERKAFIDAKLKERAELQAKVAEVSTKRDAYVAAEREKMAKAAPAAATPAAAFDEKVGTIIRDQAEAKKK